MVSKIRRRHSLPSILALCNVSVTPENWRNVCTQFLEREGILPQSGRENEEIIFSQFTIEGASLTFERFQSLHKRLHQLFCEVSEAKSFPLPLIERFNSLLSQSHQCRFRLECPNASGKNGTDHLSLHPKSFDIGSIFHFAAAQFLAELDPRNLSQCPNCADLFLLESRRRKRFCTDSCRAEHHNRIRVKSGQQARYMRKRREQLQRGKKLQTA